MIDWSKPIETTDGKKAFVLEKYDNGDALVCLDSSKHELHTWIVVELNPETVGLRNKPDLIKPEGWVTFFNNGCSGWHAERHTAAFAEPAALMTVEEALSGKFKDGIPKGYGLGGDDE